MATFEVTDPQSGLTVELTGDTPPTEQELEQIFAQVRQQAPARASAPVEQQAPAEEGGVLDAILEPLQAIGAGAVGQVTSGLAGIASLPFGSETAAENVQAVQQFFADLGAPETEAGQRALQRVGQLVEQGVDIARMPVAGLAGIADLATGGSIEEAAETVGAVREEGVGQVFGDKVLEETNNPFLATLAKTSPDALLSIVPASRFLRKAPDVESVRQGFDKAVVKVIQEATPSTKAKLQEMTKVVQRSKSDALFAAKNRPSDVAGQSLLQRVNHIKKVNRQAANRLDSVAKSLKGQQANFDGAINNFTKSLDDLGVTLDNNLKPRFDGSDIEDLAGPQNVIKRIVNRMAKGERGQVPDAFDMHRLKRFIDEQVTFGKTAEGLGGKTERILKKLRRDIDESLDSQFPKYDEVNSTFSETVSALDSLQDAAGRKLDLFGENANKAVGTSLRRLMGNAQSRISLQNAVDEVESVAKKFGGKFDDDITTQMLFADELESVFKPATRTSFKAEIGKEVQRGIQEAVKPSGIISKGVGALAEKARGINEQNALKAINKLLQR